MNRKIFIIVLLVLAAFGAIAQPVTITPPSANIDPGGSVTLTASGAMYYTWSPATGLSTTEGPVTVASPTVTTTYTCSGYAPGAESVVNGDFEQGNTGFTSAYEYNTNLFGEGTYYVDSDASLHHENFFGYGHGDDGNFMIVNGATVPGTNVWTEQITVVPNAYYAFSTWVCTLAGQANEVALLQFSINGEQIGEVFSAPPERYIWEQFYELWYSGNSTTATITILNQNTVGSGNDFGLDDISFCELVLVGAPECTVYVGSMSASATADDTQLCEGGSTTLHALPVNGSGNYSYNWTPANTLDNPTAQHPVATPTLGTTTYTCQIVDVDWNNTQEVSVAISVYPNTVKQIEEAICAYETYDFFGEALNATGQYEHHLQTQHGCDSLIMLSLTVYPANDTLVIDPSICFGDSYNFHGEIYDQDGQIAFFDTIDNHGCLKVEKLVLSVDEYQMPPVLYQYECYPNGTTPSWTWDKTGVTYHEDTYDEIILDDPEGGCPIRHRLDLKFHEEFYHEETVSSCSDYFWSITGETYHETQLGLTKTIQHSFGDVECDSTYVLNLTIDNFEPHPTEIYPMDPANTTPHWVITATEFQINSYDFHLWDTNPDCVWDSVSWNFEEPIHWVLEPFGDKTQCCRVYVLNVVEDTIWLDAHCYNQCAPNEGVTQRYWFLCSFYGLNEDDVSTEAAAVFDVFPNPNNGQMMLNLEGLTGIIDIKVYDMTGNLIDDMQTFNDLGTKSLPYDFNGRADGIYFFVATGREGTVARKVVIDR